MRTLAPLGLTAAALLCLVPALASQQAITADDGSLVVQTVANGPGAQVPGSLTTHFLGGNGFAGNMFDFTPNVDMAITGLDFHGRANANSYNIDLWYRSGTSVGFESTSTGWSLLASGSAINNGSGVGTFVDLSGNGVLFTAGQTYGLYMDNSNYTTSGGINYTNTTGPEFYSNADATIRTHCGKGNPAFTGSTFFNRAWNGTIYYDTQGGFTLTVSNLVAGGNAKIAVSGATAGGKVRHGYSLSGGGPVGTPYGNLLLSPPYTELPFLTADGAGNASMAAPVPPGTTGIAVWLHAFDLGSLTFSNGVATTIG